MGDPVDDEEPAPRSGDVERGAGTGSAPERHRSLSSLPPAIADRLRFENAAPRRLRSDKLPDVVREELESLWDGIVADVYDEVAGLRKTKALSKETVARVLARVADRLLQAERVVIVAGVHYPVAGSNPWRHVAVAGVGGGGAAAVQEVSTIATFGTATTVAIVSAVVGEVFETYVAASARTRQYLEVQRIPDPATVVVDLAEAAGYGDSAGRRATFHAAQDAATWLGEQVVRRTAKRFARGIVPVVGIGMGAGMSAIGVRRVTKLPLRPVSEPEVRRLAEEVIGDPDAYATARDRFLELADPDPPGEPGEIGEPGT
jgi:hypothetical protein